MILYFNLHSTHIFTILGQSQNSFNIMLAINYLLQITHLTLINVLMDIISYDLCICSIFLFIGLNFLRFTMNNFFSILSLVLLCSIRGLITL